MAYVIGDSCISCGSCEGQCPVGAISMGAVSYTHLRAHETDSYLVCRLLLEKKKKKNTHTGSVL